MIRETVVISVAGSVREREREGDVMFVVLARRSHNTDWRGKPVTTSGWRFRTATSPVNTLNPWLSLLVQ